MSFARLSTLLVGAALLIPSVAPATTTIYVFKASLTLPVVQTIVRPSENTDLVVTRKLGDKDLINLTLGRPLGSKVDSKTEILAWAGTFEPLSSPTPFTRLIVFDPSQNGIAQVKATIARLQDLEYATAYLGAKSDRVGTAAFVIQPTAGGPPNALLGGTLHGTGAVSGGHLTEINGEFVPPNEAGKGVIGGRMQFRVGGADVDGFVVIGKAKVSGKLLGTFEQ
jgi:hypothetical protein